MAVQPGLLPGDRFFSSCLLQEVDTIKNLHINLHINVNEIEQAGYGNITAIYVSELQL